MSPSTLSPASLGWVRTANACARALVLSLAAALAACGGGGGDTAPSSPPNAGPGGASIQSADGHATLTVPSGALSGAIRVDLTPATSGFTADPQLVTGTAYRLDAPDTALAQPATLDIDVPASPAAAAAPKERALAVLAPAGFISCTFDGIAVLLPPGVAVPPRDPNHNGAGLVCKYQSPPGCPAGWTAMSKPFLDYIPEVFTPGNPATSQSVPDSGWGHALVCSPSATPQPQIARLSGAVTVLPTLFNPGTGRATVNLSALNPGVLGVLRDVTAPTVQLSTLITPVGADQARIRLTVNATDNVGVASVSLVKWVLAGSPVPNVGFTITKSDLARLSAPPYVWESAPLPLAEIYNHEFVATAVDAAGNLGVASATPTLGAPAIASFTATPAAVPFGGGTAVLSWSVTNAGQLLIDNGVGDVTGLASKTVSVTVPTTFKLTGVSAAGIATATTSVTVLPQPTPTITSFTATPASLPVGGGDVTLAWTTTNASTLALDNGIGAVAGTSRLVHVGANTTFVLSATNGSGTATASVGVVVATGTDRFVSATSATDTLPCTQAAPCRNIATAMNGAPAGANVYLADGIYDGSNQSATSFSMPPGVVLRGANPDAVTLQGLTLTLAGGGAFNDLRLESNTQVFASSAAAASVTFTGVRVRGNSASGSGGAGLHIGGSVTASMTAGTLPGGQCSMPTGPQLQVAIVNGSGQFTVQGCTFDGHSAANPVSVFNVGGGTLVLDATTITNLPLINGGGGGVINVGGSSPSNIASLTMSNGSTISNIIIGSSPAPALNLGNFANVVLDHANISNVSTVAIVAGGGGSTTGLNLTIRNGSTVSHSARAMVVDVSGGGGSVTISNASFTSNVDGMRIGGSAGSPIDISGLTYTGNAPAQTTQIDNQITAVGLKIRNSQFSSNGGVGLVIAIPTGATGNVDLGTTASPGGNTFASNVGTNLQVLSTGTQAVNAVGNTWSASVPAANGVPATDAAGHYLAGTVVTGPKVQSVNLNIPAGVTLAL